ncbi:MAG TPA: thioredoxin family protein [Methyloceanibacter sp.]|jgi:thiol-disulfide isomerase/thioredoxin|nr:thioredoxin family protein [Methyloceanibacter sp.]
MLRLRSLLFLLVASVTLIATLPASAAEWKPFDAAAFAQAQKDGKPILVDIFAAWCPVCRAQNPILTQLTREPKYDDLIVFKIDFDTQKDAVRDVKATSQSTLIAYKGEKETGRSVGDTNPESITTLVDSAL